MSFTNLYYKRTAGTPKACYMCFRPTTTVLATKDTVDFLYTCDAHLADSGFATRFGDDAAVHKVSEEEIKRVKEEWEEAQRRKKQKEKEKKEKEKEDGKEDDKEKDKKDEKSKDEKEKEKEAKKLPGALSNASGPPTPPTPTHQRYTLHREVFAMRQAVHRKRRQATQAKEVAPRLPSAPRSVMPGGP